MTHATARTNYVSQFYRAFTVQQTDRGWVIINFPTWTPWGPVDPAPYPTYEIACMQIDRLLNAPGK
ncbi:MAG: hypothetical protein ACKN9W_01060 [Methylococcus sp.]